MNKHFNAALIHVYKIRVTTLIIWGQRDFMYIRFFENELFIIGMHVGKYSNQGYSSHESIRDRKLLLHRKELNKLKKNVDEKGKTLIPLSIYFKRGKLKIEFALAHGKKMWDKRKDKMDKDISRQLDRAIKNYNK